MNMLFGDRPLSRQTRLALIASALCLYGALFLPLYDLVGVGVGGLAVGPVLLAGWLGGLWLGLALGMLVLPLNAALFSLAGEAGWSMMITDGAPGVIAVLLVGALLGRMHDDAVEVQARADGLARERDALLARLRRQEQQIASLHAASTLPDLLTICAACKQFRDPRGAWQPPEQYLHQHTGVTCSHGLCPACLRRLYPELLI